MSVPPPPVPQAVDRGNRLLGRPADVNFHTFLLNLCAALRHTCYFCLLVNPQANDS